MTFDFSTALGLLKAGQVVVLTYKLKVEENIICQKKVLH